MDSISILDGTVTLSCSHHCSFNILRCFIELSFMLIHPSVPLFEGPIGLDGKPVSLLVSFKI